MQFKNTGEWKDKKNLVLSDDSGVSIEVTIFGADASRSDLEPGTIIAIKEAKVSDYRGKSLTVWDGQAQIIVEPKEEKRYRELKAWYNKQTQGGRKVENESLT
jgi:replication factor A1